MLNTELMNLMLEINKIEYRDSVLVKGKGNFEDELSFNSNEFSSDTRASKLQSGSGSAAIIPFALWGQ